MKVLVSGANGFIGRALCAHLSSLGHHVVPAVRRPSGLAGEYVVVNQGAWMEALTGCDSVVHLAGRAHVMREKEYDPLRIFREHNVKAAIDLAKQAVESGVRRFVLMSTIKVNGEGTVQGLSYHPDDPPKPLDPYAISKMEAEQALQDIANKTNLELVIIRAPLVYGVGVKGNFATLVEWVSRGVPLPFGKIHNRRSMIALDNLVSFAGLCADTDASPKAKNKIFLVSDGEDISTTELLKRISKAYGHKSRLLPVPAWLLRYTCRLMGQRSLADRLTGSLVVDNSAAQLILGWHPPVTMEEQLRKMADATTA